MSFFDLGNLSLLRKNLGKIFLVIWFCQRIQLVWLPVGTFLFSASILFGECTWRLIVPGKILSVVGCRCNIVHLLSTLVSFDNWVQVLAHETQKFKRRSAEILSKSFVGNRSADKNDCKQFQWPLLCLPQTMIAWQQPSSQKKDFPARFCNASEKVSTGWLL